MTALASIEKNFLGIEASVNMVYDSNEPGVITKVVCTLSENMSYTGSLFELLDNASLSSKDGRSSVHFSPSILSDIAEWAAKYMCI
jgi:hypothetical protein